MSLVFGKKHHGRHRRCILGMVPIDVPDFDDGRRRRGVLGCYVYIFSLTM
jgi:hypothetical protein